MQDEAPGENVRLSRRFPRDRIKGSDEKVEQMTEEKKESIFRKKSLDRISSPEELDRYLSVTGPGVWFPLIAVAVLLIGVLCWMVLGHLDTTLQVAVLSDGESAVCYVPYEKTDMALKGGSVSIAGQAYALSDSGLSPLFLQEDTDINLLRAGGVSVGSSVKPLSVGAELPSGIYTGEILVETVNPITFITN